MIATTMISVIVMIAGCYYLLVAAVANNHKFAKSVAAWMVILLGAYLFSIDPLRVARHQYQIQKLNVESP